MNAIEAIDRAIAALDKLQIKGWDAVNTMVAVSVYLEKAKEAIHASEAQTEVNQNGI